MDLACSIALGVVLLMLSAAYLVRVAQEGRARHERVEAEGRSALMSKALMEMFYWCAQPVVVVCAKLHVSPDTVTLSSLGFGFGAGAALATGHFGLGALLATVAGAADAIDGVLARHLRTSSVAGEVLDATVDRYVDFALLGGLAFYFRESAARLVLVLCAMLAATMVSYSTAKAEALHIVPPRGSMRRAERAVLVILAAALAPVASLLGRGWAEVPLILALGTIALLGNESAIRRIAVVRARAREREGASMATSHSAPGTVVHDPTQHVAE